MVRRAHRQSRRRREMQKDNLADQDEEKVLEADAANVKKETSQDSSDSEFDISFDMLNITSFLLNIGPALSRTFSSPVWKRVAIVLLILIPLFFAMWFRMYPFYLPATEDWARGSLENNVKNQIRSTIGQQYPFLPADQREEEVNKQWATYFDQNEAQIQANVKAFSQQYRELLQDKDGQTYFLAIDPWYYYRYARNIVDKGHIQDEIRDGLLWDNHQFAPMGMPMDANLHSYLGAYLQKFLSLFNQKIKLETSFFMLPAIIAALSVVPAFFIARKHGGNLAGFVSAMIVGMHPTFLGRTSAGFSDTDAYNVVFPLLIAWLFLEAFSSKSTTREIVLIVLAGLATGLYSFAWSGWWYIADFIIGVLGLTFAFHVVRAIVSNRKKMRYEYYSLFGLLLLLILAVTFFGTGGMSSPLFHLFALLFVAACVIAAVVLGFKNFKNFKTVFWGDQVKQILILGVIYVFIMGVAVTILKGSPFAFIKDLFGAISFSSIQDAAKPSLWPNVYTTVAELNTASIPGIIGQIGGKGMFWFASMGVILTLISTSKFRKLDYVLVGLSAFIFFLLTRNMLLGAHFFTFLIVLFIPVALGLLFLLIPKEMDVDVKYAIFLILWFIGTIYASTKGLRFILLLVPAYSVALGLAVGISNDIVVKIVKSLLKSMSMFKLVMFVVGSFLVLWVALTKSTLISGLISLVVAGVVTLLVLLAYHTMKKKDIATTTRSNFLVSWCKIVFCVFFLTLFLSNPFVAADRTGKGEVPSVNDAWVESLHHIRDNSGPDAIIHSWWDFGHWFKAIADRKVTFDGSTQNRPMAHWTGKGLLTSNETTSVGIFRMLDCGSSRAYKTINYEYDDAVWSKDLLDAIIDMDKSEAEAYLREKEVSDELIADILKDTHCQPPQAFMIASEDMVGKAGVWSHFGAWDFRRAFIINTYKDVRGDSDRFAQIMQTELGYTAEDASKLFFEVAALPDERSRNSWISPWPGYLINGWRGCSTRDDGHVVCPFNIRVQPSAQGDFILSEVRFYLPRLNESIVKFNVVRGGQKVGESEGQPSAIVLAGDTLERHYIGGNGFTQDLILRRLGDGRFEAMIADSKLSMSMFTRLFYMDGMYTDHFVKTSDVRSRINGQRIIVYEIDWDGGDNYKTYATIPLGSGAAEEIQQGIVDPSSSSTESEETTEDSGEDSSTNPDVEIETDAISDFLEGEEVSDNSNGLGTTQMVTLVTDKGDIELELYPDVVPMTVKNFVDLASSNFYDGVTFHRVIRGFMIQSGDPLSKDDDPTNDGTGGPGYTIEDEFDDRLRHETGVISMANRGPNTGGSQFFITEEPQPHLDNRHAVFGKVTNGMDVVRSIEKGDVIQSVVVK